MAQEAIRVSPGSSAKPFVDHRLIAYYAHVVHYIQRTDAGELVIRPDHSRNDWYRWLNDIQDWCISRQLWWGHQCPVYFIIVEGEENKVGRYQRSLVRGPTR